MEERERGGRGGKGRGKRGGTGKKGGGKREGARGRIRRQGRWKGWDGR